ncbi:hypothetical protein [Sporosarcina sp. Te-1]|uniref:hypothetical protein n=1 Tax=Sporosarcina sp. Te-1 TaxID=2818390 RepID=UPI001A9F6669|nr:hypothetical protein [Sporosarcina sp. Te-1]QTD40136.1 hypothetical protein J3U78_15095 [Sporosarcina sp. Te-1]
MKRIGYSILLIAIIGLSVTFFSNRASEDSMLAKDIHSLAEQGEQQIDLTTLTDFEWDKVGAFGPYSTNEMIEEAMSIKFKGSNGGIDLLEDRFLVVFANKQHAVRTVVLSRKYGDYTIKDNQFLLVEQ